MKGLMTILATAAIAALALPVAAAGNDADVRSVGKCSAASSSKIKVKPRDGALEVEFEVDQNKNGVKWDVKIKDNSDVVFSGSATTRAPSGSFSIERRTADKAGTDALMGIGTNPASGERCVAKVSI